MNILVTGGASGLGAAIVKHLATGGAHTIYFTYAKSGQAAKALEAELTNVKGFWCDFTDAASIDSFVAQVGSLELDVLVNNANGGLHKEHYHKTDPAVFSDSFARDVMPTLRITQEAMKGFRKKKFGKIINIISSSVVHKPPIGWSSYIANKSYLLAMSNVWATEGVKANIVSNCISPSYMQTAMNKDDDERVVEMLREQHPLKKFLTIEEVAKKVAYLVKAPQELTGHHIVMTAEADMPW